MIITRTPFRMSFFGGGTDMPEFFNENGGAVISSTFDKYCYVTVRHLPRFFDYSTELSYSRIERVTDIADIEHPAVRNAMQMLRMEELRITYEADLPARSGLGTSSSFAVGMLNAFHALKGHRLDEDLAGKRRLSDEAIHLERDLCAEAGGWQDQIAASYGGFNKIEFKDNGYTVTPVDISNDRKKELEGNLLMFFTGFTRFSSDVQKANKDGRDRTKELREMLSLVPEAEKILGSGDLSDFGRLLDTTWRLKRNTGSKVTTDGIDMIYEKGIKAGALGGKLLGAGGGGFFVFYAEPERHEAIRRAMEGLMYVPFGFENAGTKVLYYVPETLEEIK
ncbi:MAG: kinase [Eubacteriales bacterium]|nr:kinase [Eubacteriales bacterium]